MVVIKSSNDLLYNRHWLHGRTEEGKERKCRKNDRTEHRRVYMPRTDQRCTNVRTVVPENVRRG